MEEAVISDMESAIRIIKQLRHENMQFKSNFDTVKKQYLGLLDDFHDKSTSWNAQLQQKIQEFETLKQKYESHSLLLESLKTKLAEEVDMRSRLEKDLSDADSYRSGFQKIKRDFELYKMERESTLAQKEKYILELQQDLKEIKENQMNRNIVLDTTRTVSDIQTTINNQKMNHIIQKQQTEYEMRIEALLKELKDVRLEKSNILAQKEELQILTSKQIGDLLTENRTSKTDLEIVSNKNKQLQDQLTILQKQSDDQHAVILRLEKEQSHLKAQLDEHVILLSTERTNAKEKQERDLRDWDTERSELKNRIVEYEKKIESIKSQRKQLLKNKEEEIDVFIAKVKQLQGELENLRTVTQLKEDSLNQQIEHYEKQLESKRAEYTYEVTTIKKEISTLTNTISTLTSDKEQLFGKLEQKDLQILKLKGTESEYLRKMIEKEDAERKLREQNDEMMKKLETAVTEKEKALLSVTYCKKQIEEMEGVMIRQRHEQDELLSQSKDVSTKQVSNLQTKCQEIESANTLYIQKLTRLSKKYDKLLQKSRHKISHYKHLVVDLENMTVTQQQEISELKNTVFEVQTASQRQVKSLERQRDKLLVQFPQAQG